MSFDRVVERRGRRTSVRWWSGVRLAALGVSAAVVVAGGVGLGSGSAVAASGVNVARAGGVVVSSSSESVPTGQTAVKAVDGVVSGYPVDASREWATSSGRAGSWLQLTWPAAVTVDRVVLFDRPNSADQVTGARLVFSDGSTVAVGALPNGGGASAVSFSARTVTSVRVVVSSVSSSTLNVGLAEIEVWGSSATVANRAPIASAGVDQSVSSGVVVTLDGSGSSDPDGSALSYAWSQVSGPGVVLSSATTVKPTFTPARAGTYVFGLVVKDGSLASAADTVTITAEIEDACVSGEAGTSPSCIPAPPAAPGDGKSWELVFSEEFNGSSLNQSKLTPCFDWNYGSCTNSFNLGREAYLPSQVTVGNGAARLLAEPMSPPIASEGCYLGLCTYRSGLISTARPRAWDGSDYLFKFTYGYVEARLKIPSTQGFFTAFWLLPADPSYSYRSEIDIAEILGADPSTVFMTYHYANRSERFTPNLGQYNNGSCSVEDYSNDWVRLAVDWRPDRISWYIDGRECGTFSDSTQIESGPMQVILNLMVDHDWERAWGVGLKDGTISDELLVDYLRVFQEQ